MKNLTFKLLPIYNKFLFKISEGIETSCLNDKNLLKLLKSITKIQSILQ